MAEGIELWEYVRYGDDLLYLNQVYGQQRAVPARTDATSPEDTALEPEDTLDYHTNGKSAQVQEMFKLLRAGILALATNEGEIIETPNKLYISYRHGTNFCEVEFEGQWLATQLSAGEVK